LLSDKNPILIQFAFSTKLGRAVSLMIKFILIRFSKGFRIMYKNCRHYPNYFQENSSPSPPSLGKRRGKVPLFAREGFRVS